MTPPDLLSLLPEPDNYQIGYCALGNAAGERYSAYGYAVSLARHLPSAVIDPVANGPTREYLALYHAVNAELDQAVKAVASLLVSSGIDALAIPATVTDSELDAGWRATLRYRFSHKMAATRSGLGWIGKTDLLVTHAFGPRVRLATVLTASPAGPLGVPITESQCGDCEVCVDACPARAATGEAWRVEIDRDSFYDAFRCRDKCRELTKAATGTNLSICGICVSVCPLGR
jgi:epoxyqueuosine reductase